MKVMLLVNLKTAGGMVVPKGSVFSDEYKPLPGFIKRKVGTDMVQVLEDKPKYEVVDPDDFTMEEPEPKLEETMRYVEPVELPIKKLEPVLEKTEDLSQYEEEKEDDVPYMKEVIEKESKEEELPKKRHSKKKIAEHKYKNMAKKNSKKEK